MNGVSENLGLVNESDYCIRSKEVSNDYVMLNVFKIHRFNEFIPKE